MRTTILRRVLDTIQAVLFIIVVIFVFVTFLKMLEPLWPLTTGLFALVVTVSVLGGDRISKIMCVAGIAIYLASWPVTATLGVWFGITACALGFSIWFLAFTRSLGPYASYI